MNPMTFVTKRSNSAAKIPLDENGVLVGSLLKSSCKLPPLLAAFFLLHQQDHILLGLILGLEKKEHLYLVAEEKLLPET